MQIGQQIIMSIKKPNMLVDFLAINIKERFFWDKYFNSLREPKANSKIPKNLKRDQLIVNQLRKNKFKVVDYKINIKKYNDYVRNASYEKYKYYSQVIIRNSFAEKTLEHFIAADLLDLNKNDIYIDIANADSPTVEIYEKLYGIKGYRQDLLYPYGLEGKIIGGDASKMPIRKEFATKMGMHCSFDHFEGNSDMDFIKEAQRVLKKGGKLCVIPLYLSEKYLIETDPSVLPYKGIQFENDAVLYCNKGFRQRHSRNYDIIHLIERIRKNMKNLDLTIYVVKNEKEVDNKCYVKFVAIFEKK